MAELARKQRLSLEKQNEIGLFRVEVMEKVGEWLVRNRPLGVNQHNIGFTKLEDPIHPRESSNSRLVKNEPELKEEVILEIVEKKDVITPNKVSNGIRQKKKIAIVPEETSFDQSEIEDFLEVEAEVQEVIQKDKTYILKVRDLPINHPNTEIRVLAEILFNIPTIKTFLTLSIFLKNY
ncbi:MAG: hypothetical protein M3512_07565 [Bacteroidota bacterium]|nr:hypothetical protein [Bacteroidota bacterium]